MKKYLKLMRVHHYIKNLLVFAALACSGQIFNHEKSLQALLAFIAFCLISSVIYIINDIRDREKDRCHPTKCTRPIASGAVSVRSAIALAAILFIAAVVCNCLAFSAAASTCLAVYFMLNLAYSLGLKNIPIVDVAILAVGYLLRIMYGAFMTQITVSNWLYLTVTALAFYLAIGKRRNELKQLGDESTRKVLKSYPLSFLEKSMNMFLTLTIVFYALWSMDKTTEYHYNSNYLIFTVPIVLLIVMKYSLDVEGNSDGDPVEVLLNDKMLLILIVLYLIAMFLILYL